MGVLGFYVLIPAKWWNGSMPQSFDTYSKPFESQKHVFARVKKIVKKNQIFKIDPRKRVRCAKSVHFSRPTWQNENCSRHLRSFFVTDTFLVPTQNKNLPTDLLFGVPFWTPPRILHPRAWTLGGTRLQWAPLERGKPQLSDGVQNIKIGRRLPTEMVARRQKSDFSETWPFSENCLFLG